MTTRGYTKITHTANFNTFVICDGKKVAQVSWSYTQVWNSNGGSSPGTYSINPPTVF